MNSLGILLMIGFALAGCATQAQRQYEQLNAKYVAALGSLAGCLQSLKKTPVFQRRNEKFVLDLNDPRTVEKLASKAYVTQEEAQDIIDFSVLRKPCHKLAVEEFGKIHPEYVVSLAKMIAEADADAAKAINKELTIGEINQRGINRANQWQAEFMQIGQRITAQLNQAHQYELTQRQLAAQALQAWGYQQQVLYNQQQLINATVLNNTLNSTTRPVTMNCVYSGNMVSCH
jgi:hypothetical protein